MDIQLKKAIAQLGKGKYVGGSSVRAGWTYNPLPFPGYENVPCHRPNSPERWNIISKHTDFRSKVVLDLGCATGYFSFMAIKAGAKAARGFDYDPKAIAVCNAAAKAFGVRNAIFSCGTDRLFSLIGVDLYDIAFALTVLNWAGKSRAEKWLQWAGKNIEILWLEMPIQNDGRRPAKWLKSEQDVIDWTKRHAGFRYVRKMGQTKGPHGGKWRPLFKCQN